MILVKAGAPVDATISQLIPLLEKGDIIIDGGNEWYENTEARKDKVAEHGLLYMGMGVSGGEEGARNGEPWGACRPPASGVPAAACQAAMASWACIHIAYLLGQGGGARPFCVSKKGSVECFLVGRQEGEGAEHL